MVMDEDIGFQIKGPFRGVNRAVEQSMLQSNEAWDALNVSLYAGTIRKRDGWRQCCLAPNEGRILGIYNYLKSTGSGISPITLAKADDVLYSVVNWTPTQIASGLSGTNLASMLTMNNRVYYADGANFKVTDGITAFSAQIAQPSAAPTVATGSSGILYGEYDYKVTFYSSSWGQESPASAASTVVDVKNEQAALTNIPLTPGGGDTRVTGRRIYRRRVSASESLWHLVHEIDDITTGSWDDNVRDVDVDPLTIAPLTYSSSLPNHKFLAYQSGVLFAAGATGEGEQTQLYYSRPDMPYSMTQYLSVGSGHDTDAITGLAAFQGVLVIFKYNSIWILTGNSSDTFSLSKVVPGIGCRSHHSIVDAGEALYFLGEDGFYVFDGAMARKVSGATTADPVGPIIRDRNYARDEFCVGIYDPYNQAIMWSYSSGAYGAENDQILVYWIENSRRCGYPSWTTWQFNLSSNQYVTSWGLVSSSSTLQRYIMIGFKTGDLAMWGFQGDGDDATPINCYWTTGRYDCGYPQMWKVWGEFTLELTEEDDPSTLGINYDLYTQNGQESDSLPTHTTSDPICRRRFARYSPYLALTFVSNNAQPLEISSWTVEARLAGRL